MPSNTLELEAVCTQLQELAIRRQQLVDRQKLLSMLLEFRNNAGFHKESNSIHNEEYEQINEELRKLSERKIDLQAQKDSLEGNRVRFADTTCAPSDGCAPPTSFGSQIYFVENPPSFQAPQVILDVNQLPPRPSQTQCPHCEQYITSEISTEVGNTTWMVCMMCTFIGCVAGCCLIPFCIDNFKDIVHQCPKCRSRIHICKKL